MKDDTTASIPCNLCNSTQVTTLSRRSRSGHFLRTVACRLCGLVWSDPRPHDSRQFYEEDYRLAYKQTFEPRPKHVLRAGKVALSRLEKIRPYLSERMRILDVGSGGGEFAYLLKTLGHDVQGVEPNHGYANYAASQYGLNITRGFIGDAMLPEHSYDLITSWHVLEHTEDPGAVLDQLRRALRPGGTLVIEVPNVEAICQSPRSTFHEAHLYNFNSATLELLARKAGLHACAIRHSPDGGNLTAIFRSQPDLSTLTGEGWALPGNHDRITHQISKHTALSHYLSVHPYRRAVLRLGKMFAERYATWRISNGRKLLDALYAQVPREPSPSASRNRLQWPWLLGVYALAVLLEELLLDMRLFLNHWTEQEALSVYWASQCLVVLSVMWLIRPNTVRRLIKFAAWTAPLFALPIYC